MFSALSGTIFFTDTVTQALVVQVKAKDKPSHLVAIVKGGATTSLGGNS
jgi:hypothetical protein